MKGKENINKMTNMKYKNQIFTIPNILSAFRICLIPVFIWLYSAEQNYIWAAIILAFSGLTDLVDGFIARRFNMISDLGKILDPVADKLTQAAMLLCLVTRFPLMLVPLILLILKEIFAGVTGLLVIRKTGKVYGANWHGKVATCLIYAMMIVHVLWHNIPQVFSNASILICVAMMTLSVVLYGIRNIQMLKRG